MVFFGGWGSNPAAPFFSEIVVLPALTWPHDGNALSYTV
jgi:hypothetical protein